MLLLRSNPARILIGLAAGLLTGLALERGGQADAVLGYTAPVGKLWLDGLTMTVVPLIFSLLVTGLMSAAESGRENAGAGRALGWIAVLLIGSCLASMAAVTALLGLWPVPDVARALQPVAGATVAAAPTSGWLESIIPPNPIKAAADTAIVPLVVFAFLFGFAASRIAPDQRQALHLLFRGIVETMLIIVRWVLLLAPLGVFALALGVGAHAGRGAAAALVQYVLVVAISCLLITLLSYVLIVAAGRLSVWTFARAIAPAQIVAVSTQSSLASLPAMIEAAPALQVERASAGIILPLAVSIFRAASAAANVAVAVYLAHLHGVAVDPVTALIGSIVAAFVSLAAVGLPAQVSFFATIAPVCLALGVPLDLLPLLLAIESIPDLFRTVGNVTADLALVRVAGQARAPQAFNSQAIESESAG